MGGSSIALSAGGSAATTGRSSLQHGKLRLFEAKHPPKGAGAIPGGVLGEVPFQFNPKEMSIQKSAKWERKPAPKALGAAPAEFKGSDACKLTLELFFDATDSMDASVVDRVEKLFRCLVQGGSDPAAWPPLVVLEWGAVTSFVGFVSSVQAKYTLFAPDGTPLRATCGVTIEEMPQSSQKQNPTSGTYQLHARHTLVEGETLATLAYREYGDPALWRALAEVNRIDDPLRLRPGVTIDVPELADLLETTGRAALPPARAGV